MHRFERWREMLQGAHTHRAVEVVMRDYVESLPPGTIGVLPLECQHALGDSDISAAAVSLLQCEMTAKNLSPDVATVLHEIAHTFAAASVRLRSMHAPPPVPQQAD
jgi:hypothetical protein